MKNGKKLLFVMATAVLAFMVGCNNNNSSSNSSSTSQPNSSVSSSVSSSSSSSSASSSTVSSSETSSSVSSSEAHVHEYGDWIIIKEPTMTEGGVAKRTCECGDIEGAQVPALSDTTVWSVKSEISATHYEGGVKIYQSIYGEVTITSTKLPHTFGDWTITKDPTMTDTGTAKRVCSVDEKSEEISVPALSDIETWSVKSETPATHFENGATVYTSVYGDVTVTSLKGEHTYGNWTITVKPTEAAAGTAKRVCSVDEHEDTISVPKLTDASVWSVETVPGATHADEGKKIYTSIYGTVEVVVPAGEHVYGGWTLATNPTLEATGTAEKACTIEGCTHKETVTVPALSDETVWTGVETAPTHVEAGFVTYTSEYGTVVVPGAPALGHTFGEWAIVDEPTVTTKGSAHGVCSCGAEKTIEIPELTDTTVWTAEVTAPTHTEAGFTTYTSKYGEIIVEGDDATGHVVSGRYEVVVEDGVVSIKNVCEDGVVFGEAVKTTEVPTDRAEFTVDNTTRSHPFVQDQDNPNKWVSEKIGNSADSYLTIVITKAGKFTLEYGVSSEYSDPLRIYDVSGSSAKTINGSGDNTYITGKIEIDATVNQEIIINFHKDGSVNKGHDEAYVILPGALTYKVMTFNTNGGTSVEPSFIEAGKIKGDIPTTTKEGHYFEGWYLDEELTTKYESQSFTGNSTLYAKWSVAQHVTLHTFEGDTQDPITFQIGTTPVVPDVEREGYYFLGWYTDEACETPYVSGNKDVSFDLYAKWFAEADAHVMTGNYSGFKFQLSSSFSSTTSYAELSVDPTGEFALRRNYAGYVNGTFGAITDGKPATSEVGYAYYDSERDVVVMIDTKDMSSSSYAFIMVKDATASTSNVTGMAINSGDFSFVTFPVKDEKVNIMINRKTKEVYYDVVFKGMDGSAIEAGKIKENYVVTVEKGENVIGKFFYKESAKYATEGDKYFGDYTGAAGETLKVSGAGIAKFSKEGSYELKYEEVSENVLYVSYSSNVRYLVTLDTTNKTFAYAVRNVDVTFDYGYEVEETEKKTTVPFLYDSIVSFKDKIGQDDPTREGYIFMGWFDNAEFTGTAKTSSKLTANTTYYAKWAKELTLTLNNNNDTAPVVSKFASGTVPTLTEPTKEGFMFAGWFTDEACETAYVSEAKTTNVTLYAKWVVTPYYVGSYKGFNSDHDGVGSKNSDGGSYKFVIADNGKVTGKVTSTWKLSGYDSETSKLSIDNGQNLYVKETANGIVYALAQYSSLNFDSMKWDDFAFYAKAADNESVKFNTVYWNNGYSKITEIVVGEKKAYVYTDGDTKTVYTDVTFYNFAGTAVQFTDIYKEGKLTQELVIKEGEKVVAKLKENGDKKYGYAKEDGTAGVYTGTFNGVATTITLDGFGNASVVSGEADPVEAKYAVTTEDNVTTLEITIGDKKVKFTVGENKAIVQVLDGFEGTYTYGDVTVVVTGYGKATVGEEAVTYEISSGMLKVTTGETVTYFSVDKENHTLQTVTLSPFANQTFKETAKDYEGDSIDLILIFDNSATLTGKIRFASALFETTFEATYVDGVLVVTYTGDIYNNGLTGKSFTFTVSDNKFTCIASDRTSGVYACQVGVVLTLVA